jgi:hypothetical protein
LPGTVTVTTLATTSTTPTGPSLKPGWRRSRTTEEIRLVSDHHNYLQAQYLKVQVDGSVRIRTYVEWWQFRM